MFKIIKAISRLLSNYASPFVIASAVVAFFVPVAFGWVHGNVSSIILGATTGKQNSTARAGTPTILKTTTNLVIFQDTAVKNIALKVARHSAQCTLSSAVHTLSIKVKKSA